jgi:hypothetical protein
LPSLNYRSENWTISRPDKKKIESAEMRFLLPVAVYIVLDQKRNTNIRTELKMLYLTERIERQKENGYEKNFKNDNRQTPKNITKL